MLELEKLPKARGTFFEVTELESGAVPSESYLVRSFADAKGVTGMLRGLMRKQAAAAKKVGDAPAVEDVKSISSRSLWSGCATALKDLPADMRMGQLDHSSLEVSNGYVQRNDPFNANAVNMTDTALTGVQPTEVQTQVLVNALTDAHKSEVSALRTENERLKVALALQGASGATLDERLRNALVSSAASVVAADVQDCASGSAVRKELTMVSEEAATPPAPEEATLADINTITSVPAQETFMERADANGGIALVEVAATVETTAAGEGMAVAEVAVAAEEAVACQGVDADQDGSGLFGVINGVNDATVRAAGKRKAMDLRKCSCDEPPLKRVPWVRLAAGVHKRPSHTQSGCN
eukprot:5996829-Prymnesium_polylepis.1